MSASRTPGCIFRAHICPFPSPYRPSSWISPFQVISQFQARKLCKTASRANKPLQRYGYGKVHLSRPQPQYQPFPGVNVQDPPEYGSHDGHNPGFAPKTNYLRPLIWAGTVTAGLYVGFAFLEGFSTRTQESFVKSLWSKPRPTNPGPEQVLMNAWNSTDPITRLSIGIIGVNGMIHMTENLATRFWMRLWHIPAENKNYTLFTSAWVHSGFMHIGMNMYVLYNFLPIVGNSRLFESNAYHTFAFYAGTAILSGYGQHLTSMWQKSSRRVMMGGASGALFAVVGAFATLYPYERLGIMFLPFSFDAQSFLVCLMAFDLVGAIKGYKFVNLGHGAHLTGALLGVAYARFDGNTHLWKPLTRALYQLRMSFEK
ncbi:hypothetical protein GQ43DRAFT_468857 [Delitschia confertaspora ATCC 74209]|uniref:Peptidase S54 rhomboid domain-containing protein n=1 Tax=Delitschia confertaspora ATCC 74209 TaxID=1513339 RepID=A0A9P4JT26_9PLEO|nr:hypothetical protein GQ43DRAFT_468857 [Delitschia confertaspora ATCC 74209]